MIDASGVKYISPRFFIGLHRPWHGEHFDAAFISVNTLRARKSAFPVGDWIMDSGAFSTILKYGGYPDLPAVYAEEIRRWKGNGNLLAAVTQDFMCEKHMLARTGLTVEDHQRLTIERYDTLLAEETGVYIMPVLQGYVSKEYVAHLRAYGERIKPGMWVGVGSICKRNGDQCAIWRVLSSIKDERPDIRLHGFGLKTRSLSSPIISSYLHSADSMAWSFAARREGRNPNNWHEAKAFIERIASTQDSRQAEMAI